MHDPSWMLSGSAVLRGIFRQWHLLKNDLTRKRSPYGSPSVASLLRFIRVVLGLALGCYLLRRRRDDVRQTTEEIASLPFDSPYSIDVPSKSGNICSMCRLPRFCVSVEGTIQFPIETQERLTEFATKRMCKLELDATLKVPNDHGIRFRTDHRPTQIEFVSLRGRTYRKLDPLNIDYETPFKPDTLVSDGYAHIPHYFERSFLNTWRSLSLISQACDSHTESPVEIPTACNDLAPAIFVLDKARQHMQSWFWGFHRMIQRVYPNVSLIDLSDPAEGPVQECFRSAFVHQCRNYGPGFLDDFRRRSERLPQMQDHSLRSPRSLTVGFLTRQHGRRIVGIPNIKEEVAAILGKAEAIGVQFRVYAFESESFMSQMSAMRECDVLVASHGAGLANILLMRRGSHVIEIQPFGLSRSFQHFAVIADVTHEKVVARPDVDTVRKCAQRDHLTSFLEEWEETAQLSWERQLARGVAYNTSCDHCVRKCIRSQALYVPTEELAPKIVRALERTRQANASTARTTP